MPQASIDMTSVVEVQDADEVTGHPHSLAITDPDRVTFVKGNCREEARRWSDVLSVFPRSKVNNKKIHIFIFLVSFHCGLSLNAAFGLKLVHI